MNRDSNAYTFLFAIAMVIIVASTLAFAATGLKSRQDENIKNEKMQNILSTIGIEVDRDAAEQNFNQYITAQYALTVEGAVDENANAFTVDLKKELRKDPDAQRFPLYIANVEGEKYYIIPLRGAGLWDAIWGYISLKSDLNTIKGAVFDHKAETPGLGAEITQTWFEQRFANEVIFDENGKLASVAVEKGYDGGNDKSDHAVDAISGATITSDGVSAMIQERLSHYVPYFLKTGTGLANR